MCKTSSMSVQARMVISGEILKKRGVENASDMPEVRALVAKDPLFLIICDLPGGSPYCMLHTKAELRFTNIPGDTFVKPNPDVKLHVLKKKKRDFYKLAEMGWL